MPKTQGLIPVRDDVNKIGSIYGQSEKVIMDAVFSIDVMNYTEKKAAQIRRSVGIEVQKLNIQAIRWSNMAVPDAYNTSKNIGEDKLKQFDLEKNTRLSGIHDITTNAAIQTTENVYLRANRSILPQINIYLGIIRKAHSKLTRAKIQELGTFDGAIIDDIVVAGIENELTLRQINLKVFNYLQDQFGKGAFMRINNRNFEMKAYSRMVARTQLRITQTKAIKNISRQYENDLVRWSDHYLRVQDECEIYAGNVYSMSGNSKIYPVLAEEPPIHPNCEHYLDPYPEALANA